MATRSRPIGLVVLAVLSAALAAAAVAWACTPQANIFLNETSASAGQTVAGHGVGFGLTGTPGVTPVEIHFNSLTGNVLWSGSADASGSFTFSFAVPSVAPGYYVIVAERPSAPNAPYRTVLQVLAPPGAAPQHSGAPAPVHSRAPAVQHHAAAPQPARTPAPRAVSTGTSSTAAGRAHVAPARPAVVRRSPAARSAARAKRPEARGRSALTHGRRPARTPAGVRATTPAAATPKVFTAGPTPRVSSHTGGIPWYILAAAVVGLLFLGGAGGTFIAVRRRPRAPLGAVGVEAQPRPPVDPVDVELQRMLVEEGSVPAEPEPTLPR